MDIHRSGSKGPGDDMFLVEVMWKSSLHIK